MLLLGDCLKLMKSIPDKSVDMCLTDPPYGTTACKWDTVIPFAPMWEQLHRVVKDNGAICLFGAEPFASILRSSNIKNYRYDWYWNKKKGANVLMANKMPLKIIELCSVFYSKAPMYNPQKRDNPNGADGRNKYKVSMGKTSETKSTFESSAMAELNYSPSYEADKLLPTTLLEFSKPHKPIHPTQKPVPLLEYLIKTYTLEGETVLDFTMGSGSTGVACKNLNRKFIGIEQDDKYFQIARDRINKTED